jgi:cytochrome P450
MQRAAHYINDAVWHCHEIYGNAFAFGFGAIRFHWFVGEDALKTVLFDESDAFAMAHEFLLPIGGKTALIASEEPEHMKRRRIVQPAFHKNRLADMHALMQERLVLELHTWQPNTTINLHHRLRPVVLTTICEILLGRDLLAHHPEFVADIGLMMNFANLPFIDQQLKIPLPFTHWGKFVAARRRVNRVLYGEITRRQQHKIDAGDVLGMLLATRDEDGQPLSALEIRDQAVSLVSAGFDTTSAALTWAVAMVLEHPHVASRLATERDAISRTPDLETLLALPYLDNVFKETLRLYPAAPAALRKVTREVSVLGYSLHKGDRVALSIYATQRQASLFPQPLTFDPNRWESARPSKFAYMPFGFGTRYCIGAGVATLFIKTALAMLVGTLEPAYDHLTETGNTVQPLGGLPVRVR